MNSKIDVFIHHAVKFLEIKITRSWLNESGALPGPR